MRLMAFVITIFIACALTTRAYAESVACAPALAALFSDTNSDSTKPTSMTFKQKKEAFLSIYRAATEALTIDELRGLTREPFDFVNFVDATNLARAHEKLQMLKDKVLPRFSTNQRKSLMRAIQTFLVERISRTQKFQESWSQKREVERKSNLVEMLRGHKNYVHSVAFSPDGKTLASGSYDNTLRLWAVSDSIATPVTTQVVNDRIESVVLSPDGKRLAASNGHRITYLWSLTQLTSEPITLRGHTDYIYSVAFSPDGKILASSKINGSIDLWDLTQLTSEPIKLRGHTDYIVGSIAFSPDGKILASGNGDGSIDLWNLSQLNSTPITLRDHTDNVNSVVFSPDGTRLASSDDAGMIRIYNLAKRKPTSITLRGSIESVTSVSFSPDGQFLAAGGSGVRIWNLTQPNSKPTSLAGHSLAVLSVAFSSDGKTLASGCEDCTIRLWQWRKILSLDPLEEDAQ